MKRLLFSTTFLLFSLLTFAQFTGTVSDSQGVKYTANYDESTCYVSGHENTYSATITIPEVFGGRQVTSIGERAFAYCSGLTSVTIPSSVTSTGDYAFSGCSGLTSVTIPSSVTSIGDFAFSDCSGLTSVVIPSSVTSIGRAAFSGCSGLTSLTIREGVTSIGEYAFFRCSGLTSVTIPSSVTSIGSCVFEGCSSLISIIVEEGNTVYDSRDNCNAIIRTSDNTLIAGCKNTVILSSVTSIGDWAFSECSGLTSVVIPSSVTSIGIAAFSDCSGLTSLTIREGVTSIGDYAFSGCSGLTSVVIPSSVTSIGRAAFSGCSGLKSIVVEEGNAVYDSRDNCNAIIRTSDNTLIAGCKNTVILSSVTSIGGSAFSGCSGLTLLTIPSSVTSIGNGAFRGCSGLMSVTIPASVTSIGGDAFWECYELMAVNVNWETPLQLQNIFFDLNKRAVILSVPKGSKALYEVADGWKDFGEIVEWFDVSDDAISDSQGLQFTANNDELTCYVSGHDASYSSDLIIPRFFRGRQVTSIAAGAFSGCNNLTSLNVKIETPLIINSRAFENSNYRSITLRVLPGCKAAYDAADVWKDFGEIIEWFDKTYGEVADTQGVKYTANDDESTCYVSGHKDTYSATITIPEVFGGRLVTSIGRAAFSGCSGLTSLTIPSNVISIDYNAFRGCSGLTSVVVGWESPLGVDGGVFRNSNYNKATLFVPKGTKAAYEAANVWKDFGEIVEYDRPQENVEATDVAAVDNVIYMEPFEATKGKEVTVPLRMKNTAGIRGFQFDMQLPLGVTVAKDGNNRPVAALNSRRLPEGSAHTLTVSEQADGSVRFLCASQYDETFTGSDGEILTVRLCLDPHMLDGQYPVVLKDVTLSETNISNYYKTETVQTALTVISYTPGDISGDGEIDVSDYIGVANYIHGNTPTGFVAAAADVNKDNTVDVLDYIGIANLILYNSVYGNTNVNASRRTQRRAVTDVATLDNVVYLEPFEAKPGGEVQLKLKMKNTAQIRGFQFDLYLPEGITAKKYGNGRIVCTLNDDRRPAGDQHTLTLSERPDGAIRFLCGSQYDETFTGSDGEIATLTVCVADDMAEADYPVYLRHVKLTETDISKFYLTEEVETTAMVMNNSWQPGDATEDGDVNVTDIMAVANYILNIHSDKFNLLAADVNGDGDVNVTDIMGIANIILKVVPPPAPPKEGRLNAVEPQ